MYFNILYSRRYVGTVVSYGSVPALAAKAPTGMGDGPGWYCRYTIHRTAYSVLSVLQGPDTLPTIH